MPLHNRPSLLRLVLLLALVVTALVLLARFSHRQRAGIPPQGVKTITIFPKETLKSDGGTFTR